MSFGYDFELDRFQREAIEAFERGESVLVAAPTGSGKTLVAEHAIGATLDAGRHAFYTSPIKALANQKFRDFGDRFGRERVGLLTGDVTVRSDAPLVVMTTEVLRNMLYERSARIRSLSCVVLDEVHYLQDRERGPVWEEVLLQLPPQVRTVSLSATVSNLEEFTAWLDEVRGATTLVVEHTRPVPLRNHLAVGDREHRSTEVVPLLDGRRLSAEARHFEPDRSNRDSSRSRRDSGGRRNRGGRDRSNHRPRTRWVPPRRTELSARLIRDGLGPLIWFIFSRAGCDEAVEQCLRAGLNFTTDDEADRLREILIERTQDIDDDAWSSLGLDDWQDAFESGIASHHAGLVPAVKEAVEIAFAEELIGVVFATETLALGVNLPARTVVLERHIKYDGEDHKLLTPMEFTQLTGRAGRRGLDTEGTAVSCYSPRVPLRDLAKLASSTDFPLRSAFTPNYNMVANLIRRADREAAHRFVARSFAQFQVDRTAVSAETGSLDTEAEIADLRAAAVCEHGDVGAWLSGSLGLAGADDEDLGALRPGAVIAQGGGMIVVSVAHRNAGVVARTINARGERRDLRAGDVPAPVPVVGHVTLPAGLGPSDAATVNWAVEELADGWTFEAFGVEACPDFEDHVASLRRADKLEDRLRRDRDRRRRRRTSLERRFDDVVDLLDELGFADGWQLTDPGELLCSLHGNGEVILAAALFEGDLDGLDGPELAAALSTLVYEPRNSDAPRSPERWPSRALRKAVARLREKSTRIRTLELARLNEVITAEPEPGFVEPVWGWATGAPLDAVLPHQVTGGDFVRIMRQVLDVCRQVAATGGVVGERAAEAVICLDHGVVRSRRDLLLDLDFDDPDDGDDTDGPAPDDEPW